MLVGVGALLLWLGALSGYDIGRRRLPDWLTLPGAAAVLAVACGAGRGLPALVGAAALASLYLLVHLLSPAALGGGDVKLALGVGGLTGSFGVDVWLVAALGAPLLTVLWALGFGVRVVPHGPAMCAASAVAVGLVLW